MLNFDNLQTPPGDGDVLIEPVASHWPQLMDDNIRRLAQLDLELAGVPLDEVRQTTRTALCGRHQNLPIVSAGHQPSFIHPGVWAKQVAVGHFAAGLGALGIDFVVDNDSPASSALPVPIVGSDGQVGTKNITFSDTPAGSAYEGRPPIDPSGLKAIRQQVQSAVDSYSHRPVVETYLSQYSRQDRARDVVEQHLAGQLEVDGLFGVDVRKVRVGEVFGGPFVADLLLQAERFAEAYNGSLAEYRQRQKVRSPNRPLPDLGRTDTRIETALWIYKPMQRRRRLWVEPAGEVVHCYADALHAGTFDKTELVNDIDGALFRLHPWVVRPRAVTLMLWVRLLACDLFVHGVGGAKYDRITDGVFRRYYDCEPPAYTCVTATLPMPLPRYDTTIEDFSAVRLRKRDFTYNPDRYLSAAPAEMLAERARLIKQSDKLRETRGSKIARWETFHDIRRINAELVRMHPDTERRLAEQVERLYGRIQSNRIADSREFFYALQPQERLAALIDKLIELLDH